LFYYSSPCRKDCQIIWLVADVITTTRFSVLCLENLMEVKPSYQ